MIVIGFLRVLVSVTLVLSFSTTALVQRACASSTSDKPVEQRPEDVDAACGSDETCTSCFTPETSSSENNTCLMAAKSDDGGLSIQICSLFVAMPCLDEASENECLENDLFRTYWLCRLENGCSIDDITCDGADEGLAVPSRSASETIGPASEDDKDSDSSVPQQEESTLWSDDLVEPCTHEYNACEASTVCASCSTTPETTSAEYYTCYEAVASGAVQASAAYCSLTTANLCCLDYASEYECLGDDIFVAYWQCVLDANDCLVDDITCDNENDQGLAASRSVRKTLTVRLGFYAFVMLLPLCWV